MKICVVGLRGLPDVMGGVEMHCEQLFPLLKQRRPNYLFTIIGRKAYLPNHISEYHGLTVVPLPHARSRYFETITNAISGVIYARFALRSDLLHLHGIGPGLVAPIAKLLGMKVIVTYHSKNYEHRKWNRAARIILRFGEFCAVASSDRIITVSKALTNDLRRRFPWAATKVYFIPNGATHIASIRSAVHQDEVVLTRYRLEPRSYIVSVGRLVPEKGFHDLVEAVERSDFHGKLVIVGDADHGDVYSDRLKEKGSDSCVFPGFVSKYVVRMLLQNSSLFVLTSYNEGLPIAALEAISAGVPILLSDIEANRELGLHTENYFEVGNVDDLRFKISQDHERYRLVDSERSKILQQYDWNLICTKTEQLYSTLEAAMT